MIPVHRCSVCSHAFQVTLTDVYCMHRENYSKPVDDYQIKIDAGSECPINKTNPNYIPYADQMAFSSENIPCQEDTEV